MARVSVGILAAVMVMSLSACSSTSRSGTPITSIRTIAVGTSKYEVVRVLGAPLSKSGEAGPEEKWLYQSSRSESTAHATAFIPIVGTMLPGAVTGKSVTRTVEVVFAGDAVKSCRVSTATTTAEASVLTSQSATAPAVERNCWEEVD